jgi:hypothetical protein
LITASLHFDDIAVSAVRPSQYRPCASCVRKMARKPTIHANTWNGYGWYSGPEVPPAFTPNQPYASVRTPKVADSAASRNVRGNGEPYSAKTKRNDALL